MHVERKQRMGTVSAARSSEYRRLIRPGQSRIPYVTPGATRNRVSSLSAVSDSTIPLGPISWHPLPNARAQPYQAQNTTLSRSGSARECSIRYGHAARLVSYHVRYHNHWIPAPAQPQQIGYHEDRANCPLPPTPLRRSPLAFRFFFRNRGTNPQHWLAPSRVKPRLFPGICGNVTSSYPTPGVLG